MFRSGGILASGKRVVARVIARLIELHPAVRRVRNLETTVDDLEERFMDMRARAYFRGIN